MNMEESALRVLTRLQTAFPEAVQAPRILGRISHVPLGIEVEVPWSAYHPTLWAEYFAEGKVRYDQLSEEKKERVDTLCSQEEEVLLPAIKKAQTCMKMFEGRKYWEYCFPPTRDTAVLLQICYVLMSAGLCVFNGPHRMQVTIGGIVPTQHVYCALMYLELKYGNKERMLHGLENKGWAIKGKAGILHKNRYDLEFGYKDGVELRPLVLPKDFETLGEMLFDCSLLADALYAKQVQQEDQPITFFCAEMARILRKHNLPFKLWQNPYQEESLWFRFTQEFDSMKSELLPLPAYGFR